MPAVEPIDLTGLVAVILGCLMILIPVAGFTLRFAIKPITEALLAARQSGTDREAVQLIERRLALLEQEVHGVTEMRGEISRLLEEVEFAKALREGKG